MKSFIDFAGLKRPSSPNTYLAAPPGLCANASPDDLTPPVAMPAADVFKVLEAHVGDLDGAQDLTSDPSDLRLAFVAVTALLRFKDDVDIAVFPRDDGQADVAIYSRSRIGYSDLGANAKRGRALLAWLGEQEVKA